MLGKTFQNIFYAPAIRRNLERAYSVTPVRPSVHLRPYAAFAI